ncbi:hypothetical protein AFM11_34235 [Mycolicibacterium wolinskyi]|uniref:TIGR04222 domain-containing membrane protein n=1 Tax=Mycolicibacterium wolinskyi TaxID=59750 RepID=A0A132PBL0_9MYCO|nr:TIGR04222 domain-containing membrane protein [Mycolicibacterium wolinskyi]KWX19706.1 hypothetical protein AFM11_34235 [Mycolicibacterium wolinskyi]
MSIGDVIEGYAGAVTGGVKGYLIVLGATAVFAVLWRIAAAPRRPARAQPISATELAFLRSDVAPVVTALAGLRASGRITGRDQVDHTAPAGPEVDLFTARMLERAATDPVHTVPTLFAASQPDLASLEAQLSARGLVRTRAERARMRWGTAPSIAVLLVGVASCVYLVTQVSHRAEDVVPLVVMVIAVVLFGLVVLPRLLTVDRLTRAGRRLLAAEQERLAYLEPAKRPAFATYGPAAVAWSVALFGTGALWAVDADYSTAVQLAGSASGGGHDGGGCGASCGGDGGGGCGSGCGGCGGGCGG